MSDFSNNVLQSPIDKTKIMSGKPHEKVAAKLRSNHNLREQTLTFALKKNLNKNNHCDSEINKNYKIN